MGSRSRLPIAHGPIDHVVISTFIISRWTFCLSTAARTAELRCSLLRAAGTPASLVRVRNLSPSSWSCSQHRRTQRRCWLEQLVNIRMFGLCRLRRAGPLGRACGSRGLADDGSGAGLEGRHTGKYRRAYEFMVSPIAAAAHPSVDLMPDR